MKKKGTTESYSALIGIIIAFLMLTAIGCAVYNMYKPRGTVYFDKLVSFLKDMEEKGIDEEGERSFYVEKDQVLLGFSKNQEYIGKTGISSIFDWECYGIKFAWGIYTPFGVTGNIKRPKDNCPISKSCLCLCKISSTPYRITEDACQGNVKCATFDTLEFAGGEGCPQGVFIPGRKHDFFKGDFERGLRVLNYLKTGDYVSLDDVKALPPDQLNGRVELDKQNVTSKQETIPEEPETVKEANVVISYSCDEENLVLAEEVKSELEDNKELIPIVVDAKTEENTCPLPDTFVEEIKQDYEYANYFIQIESDDSIKDDNTVVVNKIESSPQSSELAEIIVEELKTGGLNVVIGVSEDPVLNMLSDSKEVVEIKTSKDNIKPTEPIIQAIVKDNAKKTCLLPVTYDNWIKKYAKENKISPSLLKALIKQESTFEPLAISVSGSTGLLQFSYSTAQYYFGKNNVVPCCKVEKDETIYNSCKYEAKDRNSKWDSTDAYYCSPETDKRFNPEASVKAGAEHLGDLYSSYSKKIIYPGETIKFALAAYNQGEGCINYAISEFAKTGSELYTWDEVSDYIPNTKPCHSTARANVKNYVSKITGYEKEYSTCFV